MHQVGIFQNSVKRGSEVCILPSLIKYSFKPQLEPDLAEIWCWDGLCPGIINTSASFYPRKIHGFYDNNDNRHSRGKILSRYNYFTDSAEIWYGDKIYPGLIHKNTGILKNQYSRWRKTSLHRFCWNFYGDIRIILCHKLTNILFFPEKLVVPARIVKN